MQKLTFVIGATAAGKSYFIEKNYGGRNVDVLDVYDYQQQAYDEAGYSEKSVPFGAMQRCLLQANEQLLEDIIAKLRSGHDVVVEHTLFKAKRRIAYIEEIRKSADVFIEFFVISPSDDQWEQNLRERGLNDGLQSYKSYANDIEFPNPAEGIDKIYEVVDDKITLRMDTPKPELIETAHRELAEEAERIHREDEAKRKRQELLESMKHRPFWHYCEVCGKKEFITADEAYNAGWDYPPNMGFFGLLSPRTCGDCSIKDTLFWKINASGGLPIVIESSLSPEELVIWRRIKAEPESLLNVEE